MITRLLRDATMRAALIVWAAIVAFYLVPGVPQPVLDRLGQQYSTLPLWPWALVAALIGVDRIADRGVRRMWRYQAASFACLLVIEAARGSAESTRGLAWDLAAEWAYMAYYIFQMLSAAEALGAHHHAALRRARLIALGSPLLIAGAITCTAIALPDAYRTAAPSYLGYIALDLGLAAMWLRARHHHPWPLQQAFTALALASTVFAIVDITDLFYYRHIWRFETGTAFDLVWTIPALCYIVAVRIGRVGESARS